MAYAIEQNEVATEAKTVLAHTLARTGHQKARLTVNDGLTTVETWDENWQDRTSTAIQHGDQSNGSEWQIAGTLKATIMPTGTAGDVVEDYRAGRDPITTTLHTLGQDVIMSAGTLQVEDYQYEIYLTTAPNLPALNVIGPGQIAVQQANYSYPQRPGFDQAATLEAGQPVEHTNLAIVAHTNGAEPPPPAMETFMKLDQHALTMTGRHITDMNRQAEQSDSTALAWPDSITIANMQALASCDHDASPSAREMNQLLEGFPKPPSVVRTNRRNQRQLVTIAADNDCYLSGAPEYEALLSHLLNHEHQMPFHLTRPSGGDIRPLEIEEVHLTHLDGREESFRPHQWEGDNDPRAVRQVREIAINVSVGEAEHHGRAGHRQNHRLTSHLAWAWTEERQETVFYTSDAQHYGQKIHEMLRFVEDPDTADTAPRSQAAKELDGYRIHAEYVADRVLTNDPAAAISRAIKKLADPAAATSRAIKKLADLGETIGLAEEAAKLDPTAEPHR